MIPLVSIIVPVYNVEPYLRKCLDSLVCQTYPEIEIIAVDDGSSDASSEICDEYASRYHNIKVIHQDNGGLSVARNVGMDHASGQYYGFVDSDDYVSPLFIQKLVRAAQESGADISMCRFGHNGSFQLRGNGIQILQRRELALALCNDATGNFGIVCNKLYSAGLFSDIRFPEGRIHEDEATVYQLFWAAGECAMLEEVLYCYRVRDNSIVNSPFTPARMDAAQAYQERIEFYRAKGEDVLCDHARAVYCHFLRKHKSAIRKIKNPTLDWNSEMWRSYFQIISSRNISARKKLAVSLHMLSPTVYQHCKDVVKWIVRH